MGGTGSGRRPVGQKKEHISTEDVNIALRCSIAPTSSAIKMDGVDGLLLTLAVDENSLPDDMLSQLGKARQRELYVFITTTVPAVAA